jgi:ubiquinone/menaquinone biosynthesis C-methylase UbiE
MKSISKDYILEYIFKQRCMPYRFSSYLKKKYPKLYLLWHYGSFNANTKRYWNRIWRYEGISQYRTYPQLFSKIISIVSANSKVLDIGCGVGILLNRLKNEKSCDCCGIDVSNYAISIIEKNGMSGKVATLPNIPFDNETFDVVTATEILEHLMQIDGTLNEIFRVLKNHGLLIASVPNNRLGFEDVDEHFHKFTERNFKDLLSKFGMVIELKSFQTDNKIGKIENKLLALVKKCQK